MEKLAMVEMSKVSNVANSGLITDIIKGQEESLTTLGKAIAVKEAEDKEEAKPIEKEAVVEFESEAAVTEPVQGKTVLEFEEGEAAVAELVQKETAVDTKKTKSVNKCVCPRILRAGQPQHKENHPMKKKRLRTKMKKS